MKRNDRTASDLLPPRQQATETQYELGIKQMRELGFPVPSSIIDVYVIHQLNILFRKSSAGYKSKHRNERYLS